MSNSSSQQSRHRHHHQHHDHHNHHHHSLTRPASLLLAMLVLNTLLATASSASLFPVYLSEKDKHHMSRQVTSNGECDNNMEVSAICYHCASLNTMDFQEVHGACCHAPGPVRDICAKWYTTDPKRGGSNTWYY